MVMLLLLSFGPAILLRIRLEEKLMFGRVHFFQFSWLSLYGCFSDTHLTFFYFIGLDFLQYH